MPGDRCFYHKPAFTIGMRARMPPNSSPQLVIWRTAVCGWAPVSVQEPALGPRPETAQMKTAQIQQTQTGRGRHMFRKLSSVALALGVLAMPAFADTMKNAIGNTVTTTGPDGATVKWYFQDGGQFAMKAPDGTLVSGTWEQKDGKICVTPAGGAAQCADAVEGKNVGDSWTTTNGQGQTITVSLLAGTQ